MPSHPTLDDGSFMHEAIRLAARTHGRTWPNPPVGALVVRDDGRVVGRGAHEGPGTAHAEVVALDQAGPLAAGATLYCTLEPCNHQGRTPPCAPRVAASGIRRLVVGVRDPNPSVAGGGLAVIRSAGIEVVVGVCGEAALELAWPFVVSRAFERPFVQLKTATSLDGRFAPAQRREAGPIYLTGEGARREVHCMRRRSDLVLVGAGTIRSDRPRLDARLVGNSDDCPSVDPLRGYVDTDLDEDAGWDGQWLAFGGCNRAPAERVRALEAAGGTVLLCAERGGRVDPRGLLDCLRGLSVHTVLLEAGPSLSSAFLAADLVDRWVAFVAPVVLGEGPTWPATCAAVDDDGDCISARFHLTRVDRCGPDARLVHDRVPFTGTLRALTGDEEN